jgi:hypothetical protein
MTSFLAVGAMVAAWISLLLTVWGILDLGWPVNLGTFAWGMLLGIWIAVAGYSLDL